MSDNNGLIKGQHLTSSQAWLLYVDPLIQNGLDPDLRRPDEIISLIMRTDHNLSHNDKTNLCHALCAELQLEWCDEPSECPLDDTCNLEYLDGDEEALYDEDEEV